MIRPSILSSLRLGGAGAGAAVAAALLAAEPAAAEAIAGSRLCIEATARAEQDSGLPAQLLHAVAIAESGRWDAAQRESFAWPWTVNAGGDGRFFPDKAAAIDHVRKLLAAGRRNIDVGCLQINLMYHADAFDDLDQAFDPAANAAYAAAFLVRLREETRSWAQAVASYHSRTRALGRPYWQKVYAIWNEERRRAYARERERRIELYRARRQHVQR